MNKHELFDEIYAKYKVRSTESNEGCFNEYEYAVREFNTIARAAEATRCLQYDREKMRNYFEISKTRMREAWEKRDARQSALNDTLVREAQTIGVNFR